MKDNSLERDWRIGVGPGSPLPFEEWEKNLVILRYLAKQMATIFNDLARKISADAGLDPQLLGIHPHNAMCGLESGKPWEGVDYNRVQVVQDLLRDQFIANRMVDAYDKATRLDPHTRWLDHQRQIEDCNLVLAADDKIE